MILPVGGFQQPRAIRPARMILLDSIEGRVVAPEGIQYRTKPDVGIGRDSKRYVVKSDTITTVIAEALGYGLAELVQLPVPPWALTRLPTSPFFGFCSEYQERNDMMRYLERGHVVNPGIVADTLVFDLWIANDDRNVMAFVGRIPETAAPGKLEVLSIDFELAHLLRGMSSIEVNMRTLLPRPEVRRYVPKMDGDPYNVMCRRIASLTEHDISNVFDRLRMLGDGLFPELYPSWAKSAISALHHRATCIDALVTEVLRAG